MHALGAPPAFVLSQDQTRLKEPSFHYSVVKVRRHHPTTALRLNYTPLFLPCQCLAKDAGSDLQSDSQVLTQSGWSSSTTLHWHVYLAISNRPAALLLLVACNGSGEEPPTATPPPTVTAGPDLAATIESLSATMEAPTVTPTPTPIPTPTATADQLLPEHPLPRLHLRLLPDQPPHQNQRQPRGQLTPLHQHRPLVYG